MGRDLANPKILAWHSYARPLACVKGAASQWGGGEREGRGEEQNGRREAGRRKRGGKKSWNMAADWLRPDLPRVQCVSVSV